MKKIIFNLIAVITVSGFAQQNNRLSTTEVLALSKKYQDRGVFYQKIPQCNRDSTVYYLNKAVAILENHQPMQYRQLAEIFLDITSRRDRSYPFIEVDKLAAKGVSYYNKIPDNKKDTFIEYVLLTNWASIKVEKGELKEAVALFTQALNLIQNDKRPAVHAKFLKDKANFISRYGLPEEKETALKLTNQSFSLYKKLDQDLYLHEITSIYSEKLILAWDNENDSITTYLSEYEKLLPKLKNPFAYGWYYSTFSDYYYSKNQFAKALDFSNKGIALLEKYKMQNVDSYAIMHAQLGDFARDDKDYNKAIGYYEKAKAICIANNFKSLAIEFTQELSKLYEKKGDYKKALEYQQTYSDGALLFEKERNERSLRESELKLTVINKEKKLTQKSNQQLFFITALGLCVVLLILIYRNVRLKQRNNLKLAAFNHELEDKNILLDKRNAENELLLKEIHHRVKNNLEVVSGLLALQSSQIEDQSTKDAMQESQNRVNSIGIVHQKLYQGTNLGAIEMKDYVLNLSESILDTFGAEGKVKLELAMEKLDLDIDTAVPLGLIINELITNTVKYAFPNNSNGQLTIKLEKQANNILHLVVSDNGVGKSGITKGTGFGGQLISLLTQQLNGTMTEENKNGTTVVFDFKLRKAA